MTCHGCKPPRGKRACHCALCHQNFASLRLFDKHQDVKYGHERATIVCERPEKLGLVLDAWGTWRTRPDLLNTTARVSNMNTRREIKRRGNTD